MENNLKLLVFDNFKDFGEKVNDHLNKIRKTNVNYVVPAEETRFNNGEGKFKINESIRDQDVYILSDVGNHSITYNMYDYINHKSPDDHYQDIKRAICAIRDHSKCNSIIMPLLYASRQHRRNGRESLDCASALQELIALKVKNIMTFDVHSKDIQNAIPNSSFDSFFPTKEIISAFLKEEVDFNNMFVLATDTGAVGRANLYANLFKCEMGFFRKERNTSILVDGKNPIIKHQYVGSSFKGKVVLIPDDMIASGESILEVAHEARKRGASKIYLITTFALFTKGIETFKKAYKKKDFTKLFTTNLTYFDQKYNDFEWIEAVDCSYKTAQIIDCLNKGCSISPLLNESEIITKMINERVKDI